jgi:uncharacterized protein YndB with AHSA1/START domain
MTTPIDIAPTIPRELVIGRILDAPRSAVWRCWTEPDLLMRWFTPAPWKTVAADIDVRPGGASRIVMRSPEGQDFPNVGVYLAVEPGVRLVFTDAFTSAWVPSEKPFMVGEILLADEGARTRYVGRALHWTDADVKTHDEMGFHPGWGAAADQLEAVAREIACSDTSPSGGR